MPGQPWGGGKGGPTHREVKGVARTGKVGAAPKAHELEGRLHGEDLSVREGFVRGQPPRRRPIRFR